MKTIEDMMSKGKSYMEASKKSKKKVGKMKAESKKVTKSLKKK